MRRSIVTAAPWALLAGLLAGCGSDAARLEGSSPVGATPIALLPASEPEVGEFRVERVLDPETPVLLLAQEGGSQETLAILAAKDATGNPRAITGIAIANGDDYLSIEYDAAGRPERLMTARALVLLSDYSDTSVTLQMTDASGVTSTEVVDFTPDELLALTVQLPAVSELLGIASDGDAQPLTDKAGETSAFESLLGGAITAFGCVNDSREALHFDGRAALPSSGRLAARLLFGLAASVECVGGGARLLGWLRSHQQEVEAAVAAAGCLGNIGTTAGAVLLPPLAPFLAVLAAGAATYECTKAVDKIGRLLHEREYAERFSEGFALVLEQGDLVAGVRSQVTLALTTSAQTSSAADGALGRVVINLGALGGGVNTELTSRDGLLRWTGELEPQQAGRFPVLVSVASRRETLTLHLRVLPERNPLSAQIGVSKAVVAPGESVEVFVQVQGGKAPYSYGWTERYAAGQPLDMPDLGNVSRFSTVVTERVQFGAGVLDALWRNTRADEVAIEVCGDGQCSAVEQGGLCLTDCGGDDANLCETACRYRAEVLRCGGFPGACEAVCIAALLAFGGNRPCAGPDVAYERCTFSQPALDLGCRVTDGGSVCEPQRAASRACNGGN